MKQMREEQHRRRLAETKRNREIAQLKKEQRRQEVRAPRGSPGPRPPTCLATPPGHAGLSGDGGASRRGAALRGRAGRPQEPSPVLVGFLARPRAHRRVGPCPDHQQLPALCSSLLTRGGEKRQRDVSSWRKRPKCWVPFTGEF